MEVIRIYFLQCGIDFTRKRFYSECPWVHCLEGIWRRIKKTFFLCNLQREAISQSVCDFRRLLRPFGGKARGLPKSGAPERCFTWVVSCSTHKHQTRLERLAGNKRSSLLSPFISYKETKVLQIWPLAFMAFVATFLKESSY